MSVQERLKDNFALWLVIAILGVVLGQIIARQSNVERRIGTVESKVDRIENWIVQSGAVASERHGDIMKSLGAMIGNQEKALATLEHMDLYYRRAELEQRHK